MPWQLQSKVLRTWSPLPKQIRSEYFSFFSNWWGNCGGFRDWWWKEVDLEKNSDHEGVFYRFFRRVCPEGMSEKNVSRVQNRDSANSTSRGPEWRNTHYARQESIWFTIKEKRQTFLFHSIMVTCDPENKTVGIYKSPVGDKECMETRWGRSRKV